MSNSTTLSRRQEYAIASIEFWSFPLWAALTLPSSLPWKVNSASTGRPHPADCSDRSSQGQGTSTTHRPYSLRDIESSHSVFVLGFPASNPASNHLAHQLRKIFIDKLGGISLLVRRENGTSVLPVNYQVEAPCPVSQPSDKRFFVPCHPSPHLVRHLSAARQRHARARPSLDRDLQTLARLGEATDLQTRASYSEQFTPAPRLVPQNEDTSQLITLAPLPLLAKVAHLTSPRPCSGY